MNTIVNNILCQFVFLTVAVVGTMNPSVDSDHSARLLYSQSESDDHGNHGKRSFLFIKPKIGLMIKTLEETIIISVSSFL